MELSLNELLTLSNLLLRKINESDFEEQDVDYQDYILTISSKVRSEIIRLRSEVDK